jgi:hypothetical protein
VSLENNQQVKSDENQQANRKVDNSRRSFAKKSAAIAPIVLTLANRSAWAGTNICQSGFASYTTPGFVVSHMANQPPSGSQWRNYIGWRTDSRAANLLNDQLKKVWPVYEGTVYANYKVGEVLNLSVGDDRERLAHEVATRLNILLDSVKHPVLNQLLALLPDDPNTLTYYRAFYSSCVS